MGKDDLSTTFAFVFPRTHEAVEGEKERVPKLAYLNTTWKCIPYLLTV
jgi:hypothetical protein